ncbi:hypothetical protein IW262DRAFT_534980 [Armillaria fumosa]|nr:hypothetical protein IW262DRAFT_534980 [Armillaria fumosa]
MVARLRTVIKFTAILFALHAAAFPASRIYRRDGDPSSPLPDPDENQDIQSVKDYMQKSIEAYLATQNIQSGATFIPEPVWRAIVVDTTGIGDGSDSDSAGDDIETGKTDGTGNEGEGLQNQTSKRNINEDGEVHNRERDFDEDDDFLVGREGAESHDTSSSDTNSRDSSSSSDDDSEVALANNDVYRLFDKASPTQDDHIDFFSDAYIQFTKKIGDIFSAKSSTTEQSKQLKKLGNSQSELCTVQLTKVIDQAYYYYEQTRKYDDEDTGGESSQDFKTWASTSYADYKMAYDQCQLALNQFNALSDEVYGQFRGPINAAVYNVEPLDDEQVNVPGVTMRVGSGGGSLTSAGHPMAVPYYALPGAKGTVAAWRKQAQEESDGMRRRKTESTDGKTDVGIWKRDEKTGTDDGNTSTDTGAANGGDGTFKVPRGFFSYSSSSTSGSVEGKTENGGGTVGFNFKYGSVGVGADTTENSTSTELKMKSFSIAWQAALLPIQRGTWFDGFRVASLMANLGETAASDSDDESDKALYANATEAFNDWFGTNKNPGHAAEYNDIALIVYHPIFAMEFSDQKAYLDFKETSASAGVCFLFICVGGNGGSSSNKTAFSDTSSTVSYEDLSDNVYYAGSLQGSFWTQSSDSG